MTGMKRAIRPSLLLATVCAVLAAAPAWAQISAESAWVRPSVPGQRASGGFVELLNASPSADRLVGGTTPVADAVELHTMAMEGNVMLMREVDAIPVPAKGKLVLGPGGYHMMLMGLKAPLKAGDKVPVVLRFEKAGELKVEFAVSTTKPAPGHGK
jgi:copper(I)-binding protein